MKSIIALIAAALAPVAALGQGQFLFNTHNVTAGNVLFFVNAYGPASGNDLFLAVFAGPDAGHLTSLTPLLPLNRTGAAAGYANPFSAIYTVPGMAGGQSALVGYQSFQGANLATAIFTSGLQLATAPVVLTEPPTPPNEVSIGTHTLYFFPEPSTWAMLLLGQGSIVVAFRASPARWPHSTGRSTDAP